MLETKATIMVKNGIVIHPLLGRFVNMLITPAGL